MVNGPTDKNQTRGYTAGLARQVNKKKEGGDDQKPAKPSGVSVSSKKTSTVSPFLVQDGAIANANRANIKNNKGRKTSEAQAPKAVPATSAVNPKHVEKMQRFMNGLVYGRDLESILEPESPFGITSSRDKVTTKGLMYENPERRPVSGLCGKLAKHTIERFHNDPEFDGYEFKYVTGFSPLFDTRDPEDFPKDKSHYGDHSYVQFWPKDNPDEKWIMDPSYGVVKPASELSGYTVGHDNDGKPTVKGADNLPTFPDGTFAFDSKFDENGRTHPMLMGLVKNMIPDMAEQYPESARLFLSYERGDDGRITPELSMLEKPDSTEYTEIPRFWGESLAQGQKNTALRRFMQKIEVELARYNDQLSAE